MRKDHERDADNFMIGFDNYYSTHSEENRTWSEKIYQRLKDNDHIACREITQAFDPEKELFLADRPHERYQAIVFVCLQFCRSYALLLGASSSRTGIVDARRAACLAGHNAPRGPTAPTVNRLARPAIEPVRCGFVQRRCCIARAMLPLIHQLSQVIQDFTMFGIPGDVG